MTDAATQLEQAIQQAANQYFRLVFLVGAPGSGKTAVLRSVAQKLGCPLVDFVNLELSKKNARTDPAPSDPGRLSGCSRK